MTEFAHPLVLITPHIKGQQVKDAQWLLQGHNRFKDLAPYKDGTLDGDYGLLTAQATKRAKWWLGYPATHCNMVFGQTLYDYLRTTSWTPLPSDYSARRAARLKAAQVSYGSAALDYAKTWLGYKETPINHTIFGRWYGLDGNPWCAMFESYDMAHSSKPYPAFKYAAVENIVHDARAFHNGLRQVFTPRYGDIACYALHGDPYAHTAFYVRDLGGGMFLDLGGNTGPTNISNGGMVLEQERHYSGVTAFVRVGS